MSDVLKHPLFLLLVGLVFSAYLVPRAAKRWQNRQWELGIQTSLVAEMSDCVMSFVTELEHCHPLAQAVGVRGAADGSSSLSRLTSRLFQGHDAAGASEVLTQSYRQFDIHRCVIGTKLEVYYPDASDENNIHQDWQILTESLIDLYRLDSREGVCCAAFADRLRRKLVNLGEFEKCQAAARAEERNHDVDARWGNPEQLLLAEKRRIITEVRATRVKGIRSEKRTPVAAQVQVSELPAWRRPR